MANVTLTKVEQFPNGTVVGAYPVSGWRDDQIPPSGAALGSATNSQTMTSGTLTFTGLTAGVEYFAGKADGTLGYVRIRAGADQAHATDPANIAFTKNTYTQTYSTAARTVPNATAIAAPAGGTGATAGAYDSAAHRDAMITSHNALLADVDALRQVVTALIDDLQANNLAS